ncbi:hypothetical protein AB0P44_36615, partial [Streptomyces chartreusis]|uniref:hypothetical protein n=1 Tax=Streptomyces chartreusis TaxID=1969 RepID=UPI00343E369D
PSSSLTTMQLVHVCVSEVLSSQGRRHRQYSSVVAGHELGGEARSGLPFPSGQAVGEAHSSGTVFTIEISWAGVAALAARSSIKGMRIQQTSPWVARRGVEVSCGAVVV